MSQGHVPAQRSKRDLAGNEQPSQDAAARRPPRPDQTPSWRASTRRESQARGARARRLRAEK
jgi:hypothetical protein